MTMKSRETLTNQEFVEHLVPLLVNYLDTTIGVGEHHVEDIAIQAWAFLDVTSRVVGSSLLWKNPSEN
jgi:hypothetical protein